MPAPRILCFGDSNTWGFVPVADGAPSTRYPRAQRWGGVVADTLGAEVIEEGLNGRTTDQPDPSHPLLTGAGLDGSAFLPACLASHLPLDAVAIMLGTNDTKAAFGRNAERIATGARKLLNIVRTLDGGVGTAYPNPRMLLIAPPPLGRLNDHFSAMFEGGHEKSRQLAPLYEALAHSADAAFLDAGSVIRSDGKDGLHFSAEAQRALGLAAATKLRELLG
jgi:lysophospholipase L1-like esterase